MNPLHVLLVDDDAAFQERFQVLAEDIFEVESAGTFAEGLSRAKAGKFDAILLDIDLQEERDGVELLGRIRRIDPDVPVIIVSVDRSSETARRTKALGADGYATKHENLPELKKRILDRVEEARWRRRARRLQEDNPDLVGASPHMERLRRDIVRCAASPANVLIRGETGTGKEPVAKAIHASSERGAFPLISVNAAQASDGMFEALIFGHEKGAFTGADRDREGILELADKGSLFLDEVGAMGLDNQAKLLRVIEDCSVTRLGASKPIQVDVRFITATHEDLERRIKEGRFARDFYYRIRKLEIRVPPLRERLDDIPHIARSFLDGLAEDEGRARIDILDGALDACREYDWPGNVRQLQSVLTNAALDFPGVLYADAVAKAIEQQRSGGDGGREQSPREPQTLKASLTEVEQKIIALALERNNRDHEKTARELGVSRSTLFSKMKDLGLLKKDQNSSE